MANLMLFLLISTSQFLYATSNKTPEPYVVYMGSINNKKDTSHLQMLSTIIPSEEKDRVTLIHSYSNAFKGFSAMLTEEEAAQLSGEDGVVSVFRDQNLQLHTTRSWDFLESEFGFGSQKFQPRFASDVIIGLVDTGIWPESPSFDDTGMSEIPSKWKGVCMEGIDFKKSNCNKKLIGARYYGNQPSSIHLPSNGTSTTPSRGSPRDDVGHGTHTASTAAGTMVLNASYYGLAHGAAKGGSPSSRLAMYKACSIGGCASSAVLKAIDDAVSDGVDIISISIGMSSMFQSDFLSDPIAIGAFHANQKGVLVVCSGGNDGPDPYTVINAAPWILTVAASSIDRTFQSSIVLGNGNVIKGIGINFSNLTHSASYPLVFGGDAAAQDTPASEASNCYPGSLDSRKTAGKIIVCVDSDPSVTRKVKKLVAQDAQTKGLILIDEVEKGVAFDSGSYPFSEVGNKVGVQILKYINSTKNPVATILPTVDVTGYKPAPVVAYFSARGPGGLTEGILKPDVMAPGVSILAASIPSKDIGTVPDGKKPSNFAIKSGTSMACPHVAGAAAFIRSSHRRWSPSIIRSALMTTAKTSNNLGKPLTNSSEGNANLHETGAGEISPVSSVRPGLVFETTTEDYLYFLCYYGYKEQVISAMAGTKFSCPRNSSPELISNINYPSISVSKVDGTKNTVSVTRTVTNVGPGNSTYSVTVEAPSGFIVRVSPEKLVFNKRWMKASYEVSFDVKGAKKGYGFGSLIWSDGAHIVRSVFAVNVL
ncbi:CO(2)-response secreted protease-like [Dioscorea cayenensis subsp. rotundata]|uniref:CO(2)-response secreted protease-like n=1 Tax=Dioscorea cayennensis subsp. rotundata TaxID=55577 RepID=A0AB40BQZ0_DIOCR|nr:CO(2)-response secreted protease-like [Dioscorea cayenensis subsp. rotundata]